MKIKDVKINEVYVIGQRTKEAYGWMDYLDYRKKLDAGFFGEPIEYPQVNVKMREENGRIREVDMTLEKVWSSFPEIMLAVIDTPTEMLEEILNG